MTTNYIYVYFCVYVCVYDYMSVCRYIYDTYIAHTHIPK